MAIFAAMPRLAAATNASKQIAGAAAGASRGYGFPLLLSIVLWAFAGRRLLRVVALVACGTALGQWLLYWAQPSEAGSSGSEAEAT